MRDNAWYQNRLARYFVDEYLEYDEVAEFFNNPASNKWLFDIPELDLRVELTCDDNGKVVEQRYGRD